MKFYEVFISFLPLIVSSHSDCITTVEPCATFTRRKTRSSYFKLCNLSKYIFFVTATAAVRLSNPFFKYSIISRSSSPYSRIAFIHIFVLLVLTRSHKFSIIPLYVEDPTTPAEGFASALELKATFRHIFERDCSSTRSAFSGLRAVLCDKTRRKYCKTGEQMDTVPEKNVDRSLPHVRGAAHDSRNLPPE